MCLPKISLAAGIIEKAWLASSRWNCQQTTTTTRTHQRNLNNSSPRIMVKFFQSHHSIIKRNETNRLSLSNPNRKPIL